MNDFTKRNEQIKKDFVEITALLKNESLKNAVDGLILQKKISAEVANAKLSKMRGEVTAHLDSLLDEYNRNITNS